MATQKTLQQVVNKMHRWYAGDAKYPTPGSADWNMYVEIVNDLKDTMAQSGPSLKLRSCWEERTFGTASAANTQYELDDDVTGLSDFVYLDQTDGNKLEYGVIKAEQRGTIGRHQREVWSSGTIPLQLNFSYIPSSAANATIRAGVFFVPEDVSSADEVVPVDNPAYIIFAGAAELAFNDPSKEDKFPDLNGMANDEWQKMVDAAVTLPDGQANTVPIAGFYNPGHMDYEERG